MIIEEIIGGNPNLVRRYSDRGMLLLQEDTGMLYGEAVDLVTSPHTYQETDTPVGGDETEPEEEATEEEETMEEE